MTSQPLFAETRPLPAVVVSRERPHVSDVLVPVALCLWGAGLVLAHPGRLSSYGLPPDLPLPVYGGIAVLVVSAAAELRRTRCSSPRLACHAVALVVMLYGIAPLVYPDGRYEWLYKTVGPVQYIAANGHLDRFIDIYQNWPGFFALAAWFDKVAGVASPLAYAKWAQLAFELAAIPLLYLTYTALGLSLRQRWLAILLYSASNWIGQDYFSPQALGTLLSLAVMAMAMRWMYTGNLALSGREGLSGQLVRKHRRSSGPRLPELLRPLPRSRMPPVRVQPLIALLLCYLVLVCTHELSPYMIAIQLGVLAVFRLVNPRWLPLVLLAIAIGYLAPRFAFVNSHYGLLNSIGDFFSNATPPSFSATAIPAGQHFIEHCSEALSLGIWALAGIAAWRYRHSGKTVLALALLAYSPILLLGLQAYGHEGILRVYLFSLPWSAALIAAYMLAPTVRRPVPRPGRLATMPAVVRLAAVRTSVLAAAQRAAAAVGLNSRRRIPLRAPLALAGALVLFFPAFFGDDSFNEMPAAEVSAVTNFWLHAQPGPVYEAIDNAPVADTSRYSLFPLRDIFGSDSVLTPSAITPSVASTLATLAAHSDSGEHSYVMITSTMRAYTTAYGEASPHDYAVLVNSLDHSPAWAVVLRAPGVVIYELRSNVTD